ncbi:Leader peptidase (Prepilin peptidase) [Labilithrix luteola]|uniref:Prepilin leader peptidase/N-methyltransferase n=1 Tax=Labilithrix luteola TaxID=1391654 RepID=A0A0K1PSS5_9BACT|nr:A24 family peptidase [Labilithrix luteola]AKU96421.1 Leader peptidase (Prepilin peptidase) [Labilithrix luteola]
MMTLGEIVAWIPLWLLRASVFVFGLLWGSFLNVVIYRVPLDMSVVFPGSHCPGCGKPVAGYDNIPVLSYVILRGRARCCGARMSPRYPLVELLGGALSLAVFEVIIRSLPGSMGIGRAAAIYAADFALCLGLVAAAFIDLEHMILPDRITLGGVVLGIATATLRGSSFRESIVGALIGLLMIWFPLIFLFKGLTGRNGMGLGDAKLVALAGAWFGWPGAVFTLFAGAFQGALYAMVMKVLGIELKLPKAVQDDIDRLKKAAAEGDPEAIAELEEDPLTESEGDAFILRWIRTGLEKLGLVRPKSETAATEAPADEEAEEEEPPQRTWMPFGPFLILACLELLFAGDLIAAQWQALFASG